MKQEIDLMSTVSEPPNVFKDPSSYSKEDIRGFAQGLAQLASILALALGAAAPTAKDEEEEHTDPQRTPIDLAHLAVRDDGALMVSLDVDAADRDTTGRELVTYMLLTEDEAHMAHETALDGITFGAVKIINKLPRKKAVKKSEPG